MINQALIALSGVKIKRFDANRDEDFTLVFLDRVENPEFMWTAKKLAVGEFFCYDGDIFSVEKLHPVNDVFRVQYHFMCKEKNICK